MYIFAGRNHHDALVNFRQKFFLTILYHKQLDKNSKNIVQYSYHSQLEVKGKIGGKGIVRNRPLRKLLQLIGHVSTGLRLLCMYVRKPNSVTLPPSPCSLFYPEKMKGPEQVQESLESDLCGTSIPGC